MCRYGYSSYGTCGHSVIDCRQICGVALWRAGITGVLILCVPDIFGRSNQWSGPKEDEPPQLTEFDGYSGYCSPCVNEFEIQDNCPQRENCFGYITGAHGHNSHDAAPYFQVEQLLTTFPHLLAIDQQLIDAKMDLGPAVLFPESLEKLTWASLRQQQPYEISGFWTTDEGTKTAPEILNSLQCTSGMSPQDRNMFVHVLTHNLSVNEFYEDVFKSRGMPYPMFIRLYSQIKERANAVRQLAEKRVPEKVNHQPITSVQWPRSQPLNDSIQDGSPGGAKENCARSDIDVTAIPLSQANLPQTQPATELQLASSSPSVQVPPDAATWTRSGVIKPGLRAFLQQMETSAAGTQGSSDFRNIGVNARLQHQEKSRQAPQGPRGTKRLFSSMQEESSRNTGSSSTPSQSQPFQEFTGRPVQRPRHSQSLIPPYLSANVPHAQTSTTASSLQLAAPTVVGSGATANCLTGAPPAAQAVPIAQQTGARPVGQFDVSACRAMQTQARAAQAIPLQPPSAEVLQAQATILQAAQARAAQSQDPQPQAALVDASRAQMLQAQYRQSQAPSEREANQTRALEFEAGFNEVVQARGLLVQAAQAGLLQIPNQARGTVMYGIQADSLPNTLSSTTQSSFIQSAVTPSPTQQALPGQSSPTQSTATPSPPSQQPIKANMEDIPGKGKGVLPHAITKATFFLNDKEKYEAISHVTRAWAAYRKYSEGSAVKERAASWIVNFSLNFRQHWTLSTRPGGSLKQTTFAQLVQCRSDMRFKSLSSSASAAGAAPSQFREAHIVVDNQATLQQHMAGIGQDQITTTSYSAASRVY